MTDTDAAQERPAHYFKIRISKAKADLDVNFNDLPPEVQLYIVEQGLSKLLNGATAKETAATTPDEKQRGENAMALATKKLDALKEGKFRATAKSGTKASGVVMTEARRLSKNVVKAKIKADGGKISDYSAKALTEAANAYLAEHPEMVTQAQTSLDEAAKLAAAASVNVASIPVDPEKVKAREAANEAKRLATAAKNAGKPGGQKSTPKKQAAKPAPVRAAPKPGLQANPQG